MDRSQRPAREGRIKVVYDVPDAEVDRVMRHVQENGFDVQRYYRGPNPKDGGAPAGSTRVGAEQARRFSEHEIPDVQVAFDAVRERHSLPVTVVAFEVWEAG